MSEYHQPHETASILGITPATLRRWAEYHKAYLSPDTQPSSGQPRRFTNRDIEILKHCKHLRDQGLTVASINDQLADLTFPEIDANQEIDQAHDDQPDDQVTAVTAPPQAPLATLDAYAIEAILTRVAAVERAREPALIIGFGLGFIGALLLVLLIIGLAVLYGGFR